MNYIFNNRNRKSKYLHDLLDLSMQETDEVINELEEMKDQLEKDIQSNPGKDMSKEISNMRKLEDDIDFIFNKKENIEAGRGTIAPAFLDRMKNVASLGEDVSIFRGGRPVGRKGMYKETDLKKSYELFPFESIMSYGTSKSHTGEELMMELTEFNSAISYAFSPEVNTSAGHNNITTSYDFMKNKAKRVISFDLETHGGKDEYGRDVVDKITEFAFVSRNEEGSSSVTSEGYVGIFRNEREKYRGLIKKFEEDPDSLTGKDQITLKSIAKLAHDDMKVEEDPNTPGRFTVKNAPDERKVDINKRTLEKGLSRAIKIGERQEETKLVSGVMQWEKDLIDTLGDIQKDKEATVLGHNVLRADTPWINQLMAESREETRNYFNETVGGNQFKIPNHRVVDTLPIMQRAMADPSFFNKFMDKNTREMLNELGVSMNSLEALSNRGLSIEDLLKEEGMAHTASYDALESINLVFNQRLDEDNLMDEAVRSVQRMSGDNPYGTLRGGGNQLFYANKSVGGDFQFDTKNLVAFRVDPMSGTYETIDGYSYNPLAKEGTGKVKKRSLGGEWATKSGVTYTIDEIMKLNVRDESRNEMLSALKEISPALSTSEDLVAVRMSAVSSLNPETPIEFTGGVAPKQRAETVFVGTQQEIQQVFNNKMVLYAEREGEGQEFRYLDNARKTLEKQRLSVDEEGKVIGIEPVKPEDFISETIEDGVKENIDSTAGRAVREMDLDKTKKHLDLLREIDLVKERSPSLSDREVLESFIDEATEVSRRIHAGETVSESERINNALYRTIGYDFSKERMLGSRTVDGAAVMLDYTRSIEDVLKQGVAYAEDNTTNSSEARRSFTRYMDRAHEEMNRMSQDNLFEREVLLRNQDLNFFEIETKLRPEERGFQLIESIEDTQRDGILRVHLDQGESRLIRNIVDSKHHNNESEKRKRLAMLMEEQGIADDIVSKSGLSKREYRKTTDSYIMAREVILSLKDQREKDPLAGILSAPTTDVVTETEAMRNFSSVLQGDPNILNKIDEEARSYADNIANQKVMYIGDTGTKEERVAISNIVDRIIMHDSRTEDVIPTSEKNDTVKWVNESRDKLRKDANEYVQEILRGTRSMGAELVADFENKEIYLKQNSQMHLLQTPKESLEGGAYFLQVGGNRVSMAPHAVYETTYPSDKPERLALRSPLGAAASQNPWSLPISVENAQRQGKDPLSSFSGWIGGIMGNLREGPAISSVMTEQDPRSMFSMFSREVIGGLRNIPGIEDLSFGEGAQAKKELDIFLDAVTRDGFEFDKMSDSVHTIYNKHMKNILEFVDDKIGIDSQIRDILPTMSNRSKASQASSGEIRVMQNSHELELFNNPARMFDQNAAYNYVARETTEELIGELELTGDVYLSSNARTSFGRSRMTRGGSLTGQSTEAEFMVRRAFLGPNELKSIVQENMDRSDPIEVQLMESVLLKANPYEGASVASSRLGDVVLQNYDRQTRTLRREMIVTHQGNLETIEQLSDLADASTILEFDEDGNIVGAKRPGGVFKNTGDVIYEEESFGGRIERTRARRDGLLRLGFFSRDGGGILVDEDKVLKAVQESRSSKALSDTLTEDQFFKEASELFDMRLYVEDFFENPYQKLQEDRVEKGMATYLYTGLGRSEKPEVQALVRGLGLEEFEGRVLSSNVFRDIASLEYTYDPEQGKLVRKDREEIMSRLRRDYGIKNPEEAVQELISERHMVSDKIQDWTGAVYISNTKDLGHENVARPYAMAMSNMLQENITQLSGGDTSRITPELELEAARITADELEGTILLNNEPARLSVDQDTRRINVPEMDYLDGDAIDFNRLQEVYDEKMVDSQEFSSFARMMDSHTVGEDGRIKPIHSMVTIASARDYSGMGGSTDLGKGAKFTDRELLQMDLARIDDDWIKELREVNPQVADRMSHLIGVSAESAMEGSSTQYIAGPNGSDISGYVRNRSLLEPMMESLRQTQFMQHEEDLFLDSDGTYHIDGERYTQDDLPGEYRRYGESARVMSQELGGAPISMQAVQDIESIGSSNLAISYNRGDVPLDRLISGDYKFQEEKILDIDFTSGRDADYFDSDFQNSIYRRNTVIDFTDAVDQRILSSAGITSGRIAIGELSFDHTGENISQNPVYQQLSKIQDAINSMSSTSGYIPDERSIERHEKTIEEGLAELNESLSREISRKEGAIATRSSQRVDQSVLGRSSLIAMSDLDTVETKVLSGAMFDGMSVLDHHKSGTLLDFTIVGRESLEKMGLLDEEYLRSINASESEMLDSLRGGVQGVVHRNPSIYEGSVRPSVLIFSDDLDGSQVVSYAAGSGTAKEDSDGDSVKVMTSRVIDSQGREVSSVEHALTTPSERDAVASAKFDTISAGQYYNAIERNPHFERKIQEDLALIKDTDQRIAEKLVEARANEYGIATPELSRLPTEEVRGRMISEYNQLIDHATELYSSQQGISFQDASHAFTKDESLTADYLNKAIEEIADDDIKRRYADSAEYYMRDMSFVASDISQLKQAHAGEMNLPLYRARKIREIATSHFVEEGGRERLRLVEHLLEASEEAFLSPKHSSSQIVENTDTVGEFNRAFRSITGQPMRGDTSGTDLMVDWFERNLPGRFSPEKPLSGVSGLVEEIAPGEERALYRQGAEYIKEMFDSIHNVNDYNTYLGALGQYERGLGPTQLRAAMITPSEASTFLDQTMGMVKASSDDSMIREIEYTSNAEVLKRNVENFESLTDWTPPEQRSLREGIGNITSRARSVLSASPIGARGLAVGAAGVAAATMFAGFAGGNPSVASTTTQASNIDSDMYSIPFTSDDPAAVMEANPSQGYVININASSPKGRAHAEEAVRQAITTSQDSTNVNISMNINEGIGNITDRRVENYIEGLLW